jgi:hypothetical protein
MGGGDGDGEPDESDVLLRRERDSNTACGESVVPCRAAAGLRCALPLRLRSSAAAAARAARGGPGFERLLEGILVSLQQAGDTKLRVLTYDVDAVTTTNSTRARSTRMLGVFGSAALQQGVRRL